jgi:uncharacterized repeat protein (TIGR03803 family)
MQTHTQLKMFFVGVLSAFAKRTAPTQAIATLLLAVFVQAVLGTQSAHAQTFTVLYNFAGPHIRWDGAYPAGGLVQDAAGNFYGTTSSGGVPTKKCGYCGTVFKLDTAGNETVLHSFGKPGDGAMPQAGLIQDASGNLYGTTQKGGAYNFGTVFKVDTTGKETVLYSFAGGADGEYPLAALVGDGVGNVYGTTVGGGTSTACGGGCGTVFKLTPTTSGYWKETLLHSFGGGEDGANPTAGLIQDAAGNLYGTTEYGGSSNVGTVFKLDTTGSETVLYSFAGGADGAYPYANLVRDTEGNFYGTTIYGGGSKACVLDTCGTVFKLDATGTETVVHAFNQVDGWNPIAGLIRDVAGNLYGTTRQGGPSEAGTVFKVDQTGTVTVLYSFPAGNDYRDPRDPLGSLVLDAAGNLYTTASAGGTFGDGIVFKLTTGKSTASTSLSSSLNPSTYGQKVTWTATVNTSGSTIPTGKVQFTWSGHTIGSATLNSSGVATLTRSNLNADAYPLTAVYAGDENSLGSTSGVLNQVVLPTTSAATLTSSPNPSTTVQAVTFTATIASPTVRPTGPVTFSAGTTVLGTAQISGGKATLTISSLAVGSTEVTATYYGDSNVAKSSASVIQTVQ